MKVDLARKYHFIPLSHLQMINSLHSAIIIIQMLSILIDDNEKFALEWERRGGIFIHHTSAATTLEKLQARGVLSC